MRNARRRSCHGYRAIPAFQGGHRGPSFLRLVGAASNAIAYGSRQLTPRELVTVGIPASLLLVAVLGLFVWPIWPMMGMPVLAGG